MEYLDIYNDLAKPTGRIVVRGDKKVILNENEHIAVGVIFIENAKGEFLIQKTSKEKGANYTSTGGHINHGETPLESIKREVKEELGINIDNDKIIEIGYLLYDKPIRFMFYLKKDVNIEELNLQKEEVKAVSYMSVKDIKNLIKENLMLESHAKIFDEVLKFKTNYKGFKNVITIYDDEEYLRQISKEVKFDDKELKGDIYVLDKFCKKYEVMAMAAVQLGIPKRIIYLKNTNIDLINKKMTNSETEEEKKYNEARVLINPVIISREGLTEYWEACASCGNNMGLVKRPYKIEIEYYDINGHKHNELFEGFESTVLSHEMDHLDGILHMDIADDVIVMHNEARKKFRQEHNYKIYFKKGSFDKIKKMLKTKWFST